MKRFSVLRLLLLFVLFGFIPNVNVKAQQDSNEKQYSIVIMDEAELLSNDEKERLYQDMEKLTPYGNVIFSSVTLKDGSNYEKYSEETYYKLFGNEPGVIFQIDMGNRKLTLSASTDMEKLIGHERASIVDNIYKLATNERYYECASKCYSQIYIVANDGRIAHKMQYITNAIFALILGLIINFIIVFATTRKKVVMSRLLGEVAVTADVSNVVVTKGKETREYSPQSSSSGGSGGGSSGGGGFSGGSSSHGF